MRRSLDVVAEILTSGRDTAMTLPWPEIRFSHTAAVRAVLAGRYKPKTANKILAALRATIKTAWRLGLITTDDYQRAVQVEGVRGTALPAGRSLTPGELRALFADCAADSRPAGPRDAALLALLYGCGIRRAEAGSLMLTDFNPADGSLTIRKGKGNKERLGYVTGGAAVAIQAWLRTRGNEPGPLLCPLTRVGRVIIRSMTGQSILEAVQRRADRAGVSRFACHDLRRTAISDLFDIGADPAAIQRLAGHEDLRTTVGYDRRGDRATRKAAELLHVPYDPIQP
jgi:integrase